MFNFTKLGISLLKTAIIHGVSISGVPRKINLEELMKDVDAGVKDNVAVSSYKTSSEGAGAGTGTVAKRETLPTPSTVSREETINYQKMSILKEILLLEAHLVQKCKVNSKACDCCSKHTIMLEALANETMGITGDSVYDELSRWARSVLPMVSAEASASGKYDDQYPELAKQLREIRKKVMA